jgi:hypothetical protein
MRCIACNENLTDAESTKKDAETGLFTDMCGPCLSASEWHLSEVQFQAEVLAEVEAEQPQRTCADPMEAFERIVYSEGHWKQWGDGLGLLKPTDRRIFMYNQARARFLASIENGDKLNVAISLALGSMPKRNAQGFQEGTTYTEGGDFGQRGGSVSEFYGSESISYEKLV